MINKPIEPEEDLISLIHRLAGRENSPERKQLPYDTRPIDTALPRKLSVSTWGDLSSYLNAHEDDIAHGINDFGVLSKVYTEVMGRDPMPEIIRS